MPTPHKNSENMRKHLTRNERESRQKAEAGLRRSKRVILKAPAWLGKEAREIFEATKRRMKDIELLDSTDSDLLGLYADALYRYQKVVMTLHEADPKAAASAQAWSRLVLAYAEKLGISPAAKARLARKRAEVEPPDELEQLLDGTLEWLNSDEDKDQ